jgi:hypothetical protein
MTSLRAAQFATTTVFILEHLQACLDPAPSFSRFQQTQLETTLLTAVRKVSGILQVSYRSPQGGTLLLEFAELIPELVSRDFGDGRFRFSLCVFDHVYQSPYTSV